ncbi:MAG: hypothetical protein F6J93_03810 [Oscillatoria sp. SIO1A7]|nr:hypothetical protein [Oscillatoria sp. SIO1A7]
MVAACDRIPGVLKNFKSHVSVSDAFWKIRCYFIMQKSTATISTLAVLACLGGSESATDASDPLPPKVPSNNSHFVCNEAATLKPEVSIVLPEIAGEYEWGLSGSNNLSTKKGFPHKKNKFTSLSCFRSLDNKRFLDRTASQKKVNYAAIRQSNRKLLQILFATPDSPGSIAIGTAEGTRTSNGETTAIYWGHTDPGNGLANQGTFSYQHGASNPREADWIQLKRLRGQVEYLQHQAENLGVKLSTLELVAGADLANQSPLAAMDYVGHLQKLRAKGFMGIEAVLEARVQSFVNPKTGVLEAGGFGNSWQRLRHDQLRRMIELNKTLKVQGVYEGLEKTVVSNAEEGERTSQIY